MESKLAEAEKINALHKEKSARENVGGTIGGAFGATLEAMHMNEIKEHKVNHRRQHLSATFEYMNLSRAINQASNWQSRAWIAAHSLTQVFRTDHPPSVFLICT